MSGDPLELSEDEAQLVVEVKPCRRTRREEPHPGHVWVAGEYWPVGDEGRHVRCLGLEPDAVRDSGNLYRAARVAAVAEVLRRPATRGGVNARARRVVDALDRLERQSGSASTPAPIPRSVSSVSPTNPEEPLP